MHSWITTRALGCDLAAAKNILWASAMASVVFCVSEQVHGQIPEGLSVGVRDFAVLPDSGIGNSAPARVSVMTSDPQGRLFANDQRGQLYLISSDGASVEPYLDLNTIAGISLDTSSGERGLQSFAFHPDFATESTPGFGKFYTLHSDANRTTPPTYEFSSNVASQGSSNVLDTVLLEWTVSDPFAGSYASAGGLSPREVLRLEQPRSNHNGGLIAFNSAAGAASIDRANLYVAIGDGGGSNDPWNISADPASPYGKILRIDPLDPDGPGGDPYSATQDNVFAVDNDATTLSEVYAYGLRNPQRFGWDDQTGDLFVADIGQNAFEEVNLVVNGGNYGWDAQDGNANPPASDLIDPIAAYGHGRDIPFSPGVTGGRAITLGEVVRGSNVAGLDGLLLTGDFPTGTPLYVDVEAGVPAERTGSEAFRELVLIDVEGSGAQVELLDLINATRIKSGLTSTSRADLRWSLGTDGRVFLLNKRDGVIRELVAVPEPSLFALILGLSIPYLGTRRRSRASVRELLVSVEGGSASRGAVVL